MQARPPARVLASAAGPSPSSDAPWWRFGIVWFALSGPAIVVVAGFATMAIAFNGADEVLPEAPLATKAPHADATGPSTPSTRIGLAPEAPALRARNHAATPSP